MKYTPLIQELLGLPKIEGLKEKQKRKITQYLKKEESMILNLVAHGAISIIEAYKRMLEDYQDPNIIHLLKRSLRESDDKTKGLVEKISGEKQDPEER